MLNYHAKYLKYKQKYINLTGGSLFNLFKAPCNEPEYLEFKDHYERFKEYLKLGIPPNVPISQEVLKAKQKIEVQQAAKAQIEKEIAKQKAKEKELELTLKQEEKELELKQKLKATLIRGDSIKLIDFLNVLPNESDKYFYFNDKKKNTPLGNFLGISEDHIDRFNDASININFKNHHFILGERIVESETLSKLQIYQDNSKK